MKARCVPEALLCGVLIFSCAAAVGGCRGSRKKPSPAPPASPPPAFSPSVILEPPPPPPPPPGEQEMAEAANLIRDGEIAAAAAKLEEVIALGSRAPAIGDAIYLRALLAARPDHPGRDLPLARDLLNQVLEGRASAERESEARLILSLLDLEEESSRAIEEIRSQIATMKAQEEEVRAALAQREDELRRIKEILLEKAPRR